MEAPLDRSPDGLLLRRYRAGDEEAFAELRARHERLVFSTCRRETGDAALAEDAMQGVFLLLSRKSFPENASLAGWLHGAARLVSKNLVRAENRRRHWEARAVQEVDESVAAWNAIEPLVDNALASLKSDDREAILLRYVNDLSLAEVGAALRISENSARMRVTRALERLRVKLRQAGVGLTALLLATLLSSRFAEAAPTRPHTELGHRPTVSTPLPLAWRIAITGLIVVGAAFVVTSLRSRPHRLSGLETDNLLSSMASKEWKGTLEFADDASGERTKTETRVAIDRPNGGLRTTARFPAFRNVDVTTFTPMADGRFRIETGGPGSSHRLDGVYDLVHLPNGSPAFMGFSLAAKGDVLISVQVKPDSLIMEEDVKRNGGEYRLRNRFELRR